MAWAEAVTAVADSVSAVANTISAYGPNDEAKVVKAADKAGDNAKKLVKKKYPKCETDKEYKKKIEPLKLEGVTSRAVYNNLRATKIEEAYKEAYNQVINMYKQRLANQTNATPQSAQESFQQEFESSVAQQAIDNQLGNYKMTSAGGCAGMAGLILIGASALSYLTYIIVTI